MRDLGYAASEGSFTVPYRDGTPAGILALQGTYFEFIPEGEDAARGTGTLRCHELEDGKRYRVILTNHNGLYRYDINDVVEVRGFHNRTPMIAFVRKGGDMLNITGEKLHVNHLLKAFRRVEDELGLGVVRFRAVPNYAHLRYEMLVHVAPQSSSEFLGGTVLPFIDRTLCEANVEYSAKRKSRRLRPPCIHVMDSSWEESARRLAPSAGRRDVQYKWHMVAPALSEEDARHIRQTVGM
ncbi:MAG: GH3 domain-containing protein [Planctomycetota bacterium]|jgi:hypothetical protein